MFRVHRGPPGRLNPGGAGRSGLTPAPPDTRQARKGVPMKALMMTTALLAGQVAQPGGSGAGRDFPTAPTVEGNWAVVHMARDGQTIPPAGLAMANIRGGVLTFAGEGVQYPSIRLDFGAGYTVRASMTLAGSGTGGGAAATPGGTTGRTSVGPTPPAGTPAPPRADRPTGPMTVNGIYVLSGDYLVLSLGTTSGSPRAGSGQSGGCTGTGAVNSTGGTPRGAPGDAGPPAMVLILRRA